MFTTQVLDETRYLHWSVKDQLLFLVSDKELATPIEKVNKIMGTLLALSSLTKNIERRVLTNRQVNYLTYLHVAKPYLENNQVGKNSINWFQTD